MSNQLEMKPYNDLPQPLGCEKLIEQINFMATVLMVIKSTNEGQEFRMKIGDVIPEWPWDDAFHTLNQVHKVLDFIQSISPNTFYGDQLEEISQAIR